MFYRTNFSEKARRSMALLLIVSLVAISANAGNFISFKAAPTAAATTIAHADGITATGADSIGMVRADSLTATSFSGLTILTSSGRTYRANSVFFTQPNGIVATGADGIVATGADGIVATGADALSIADLNGIVATGADGISISGATGIVATGADGATFSIASGLIRITGANGIVATGADGVTLLGLTGLSLSGVLNTLQSGLKSLDSDLSSLLSRLTDDSNVNAVIIYHRMPTESDFSSLRQIGILGGVRYRALPAVSLTATKAQINKIAKLPAVRSIYGNRTLKFTAEPGNGLTGTAQVKTDAYLSSQNNGRAITGRGVTVAVLDTGLDGLHGDISGRVTKNVKLLGTLGLGIGFIYPPSIEGLPNTDLIYGHGTFVGGVIAGNGARSNGRYTGVAPGAKLVGLGAGDITLLFVLEGLDYLLWKGPELGVRAVNCSFSGNSAYDPNDPVNVATKLLTERNISVVFSAGNTGPGPDTLNPYALAPWVISVGATDQYGELADFSSRGSASRGTGPTLVAPGVNVVSLRASGVNLSGLLNLGLGGDLSTLSLWDILSYTVGTGTSFSAPQVTGSIALMLEANPLLTPAQIRNILKQTATPMPNQQFEVGAGMLNAYSAVQQAISAR